MTKRLHVYETPDITVSFDPNVCKHTGVCLRTLPAVFDIRRSRWIQPEAADATAVADAVQKCPSGALQFYRNTARDPAAASLLVRRVLTNTLAVHLSHAEDREAAATAICDAIAKAGKYDFVGLYDVAAGEIAVVGWRGATPPTHPRFSADFGLCGAAAHSKQTVIVNDVAADNRYITTSAATRSEMIVPVLDPATREVVGTIDVASDRLHAFRDDDRTLIEDCARVLMTFWTEAA